MVAKYRRQVRTGEIGVIRADMSVANSLGEISNAVSKMSNEAFKMAADTAEERGRDYISSKSDDEIFGIDPETGKAKNLMTELLADLPAKGYGMIAQNAIKSEAAKRFGLILETKFREQGANAQAKFPLNPGKASAMLEEFTDELASKYEGEYKNKIVSYGTSYASGVRNTLLIRQANNQMQIAAMNNSRIKTSYLQNEQSIAETSNHSTVQKLLQEAENPNGDKLKDIHSTSNSDHQFTGGKAENANQFKKRHQSNLAVARIKGILREYSDKDLKPHMRIVQIANGAEFKNIEGVSEVHNKQIKEMLSYVTSYEEGRSDLNSAVKGMVANQNAINNYVNQQTATNESELIASLGQEAYNQRVDYLSILGGKRQDEFVTDLSVLTNIPSKIEFAQQLKNEIRTKGSEFVTKTVNGETVRSSKPILSQPEIDKIDAQINKIVASSVGNNLIESFTENGRLNTTEMRRVMSAIKSGKMPDIPSMTSGQKKALESIVPLFAKDRAVGPGGMETVEGGKPNLDFDARTMVNNYLEREIGNANQLASAEKQQIKLEQFAIAIRSKEPIDKSKENEDNADLYLLAEAQNNPALKGMTLRQILLSPEFANPESNIRKTVDSMLKNNQIVSTTIKELTKEIRKGLVASEPANMFLDFIVKGTTLMAEQDRDGAFRYTEYNLFSFDEDLENDVVAIQNAFKISQISGGTLTIAQVLANEREYRNSDAYKMKVRDITGEDTFAKAENALKDSIAEYTGGKDTIFYNRILNAMPHIIYRNRNATVSLSELEQETQAIMTEFFPKTEDFVLDPQSVRFDGNIRSTFALNRLFNTPEMKDSFLQYVQEKLQTYGDYSITDGDRDGIESQDAGFFAGLVSGFNFRGDRGDTVGRKKAWLTPSQFASTDPFQESVEKQNVTFFLTTGVNSELSFIVSEQEVAQVSMKEFRHWRKTGNFLKEKDK
tara:strand:- start:3503 stop:6349 length:2847 start_codon:yes stop_codon:yes gene_type:complete